MRRLPQIFDVLFWFDLQKLNKLLCVSTSTVNTLDRYALVVWKPATQSITMLQGNFLG